MATTIVTKNSSTASAVPTAAQLVQGELAVNVADKKLYTEDNAGSIIVLADGVKLDGIEALADVTDTANVTAAGALMDSELTNITAVKALNQGVATTDSPSFVGLTASGEITANGGIALGDNDKATFGDSDDLQIYHTGSNSVIADAGTGNLIVRANDLRMTSYALEHNFLQANESGAVTLYHNNAAKLATTSTGIDVTGVIGASGTVTAPTFNATSTASGGFQGIDADTITAPSFTWTSDLNTGMWHAAADQIGFTTGGVNRVTITSTGITAVGDVTAYSDMRLKENIEVIPNAVSKVQQLRGVTFTRNDAEDLEKRHTGVIAQEVEAVLPEAVSEDNAGIKNVAYGNMVGLLIEAIKELKAEVDDLKAQLVKKENTRGHL